MSVYMIDNVYNQLYKEPDGVCQVKCVSFLLAVFVTADFI